MRVLHDRKLAPATIKLGPALVLVVALLCLAWSTYRLHSLFRYRSMTPSQRWELEMRETQRQFCKDIRARLKPTAEEWNAAVVVTATKQPFKIAVLKESDVVSDLLLRENERRWHISRTEWLEAKFSNYTKLGKSFTFVDVGAHLGYFSLMAAAHGGKVFAFEPLQTNVELFRRSICLNNFQEHIVLYPIGLSDQIQRCGIYNTRDNLGNGIVACTPEQKQVAPQVLVGEVALYPLDDVLFEDLNVVKVDTEGFEPYVIRGMNDLIHEKNVEVIITKWCPEMIVRQGNDPVLYLMQFTSWGYELWLGPPTVTAHNKLTRARVNQMVLSEPNSIVDIYIVKNR